MDLLPPSAKLSHEDAILARHWHEPLDGPRLKQALAEAVTELPSMSSVYYGPADSVVVACYAAENLRSTAADLPVAMNLSAFVRRAAAAAPGPVDLPAKVYKMAPELAAGVEAHQRTAFLYPQTACIVSAPMPAVTQEAAAESVPPGVQTAATLASLAAEGSAPQPTGSLAISRGGVALRWREGSGAPADKAPGEGANDPSGAPLLLGTLPGGSVLSAFHVVDPAAAEAARLAEEEAARLAEEEEAKKKAEAEAAAAEEGSEDSGPAFKPMMSAAEALKAGNRGMFEDEDEDEDEDYGGGGDDLNTLLNKDKKPPPVTALQVTTPSGHLIRMTTDGQVLVAPADDPSLAPPLAPFRGVAVHGAPLPGADLAALRAPATPNAFRAVTRDGLLVSAARGAVARVLCPDGSVSERLDAVEGWLGPDGAAAARGWLRTALDGTRLREPDEGSKPKPPPTPPPEPESVAEPEPEVKGKGAKAGAKPASKDTLKKGKGKGKGGDDEPTPPPTPPPESRRPQPPPPPPFTLELPAIGSATLTDPDTGARVTTREDNVMVVAYPAGDVLVQDYDGTRITRAADGAWSVEMDGFAPILGSPAGLTISPCPGVTLSWDATTGVVTGTLPDGSAVLAAPHAAAFAPAGVQPPPLATLASEPEALDEDEDDEDEDEDGNMRKKPKKEDPVAEAVAAANLLDELAANPDLSGIFLFDPRVRVHGATPC